MEMPNKYLIELKPVNYWVDILAKGLLFYLIIIICLFVAFGYYSKLTAVELGCIACVILMIPFYQATTHHRDNIHYIFIKNDQIVIKWKHYNNEESVTTSIENIEIEMIPFLKNTYKMNLLVKGGNIQLCQMENSVWTRNEMKELIKALER